MNINVRLNKNFVTNYNKMLDDYGEEIAKINGFSDQQLSYTDFISNFIDTDTVADASVDGNANVGQKDIVTLINEMPKPHQKLLAFNKIYYEINKKYGFKTANDWLRAEWDGHLYLHDANTSSFVHYCFAYDLKDLAEKGLFFIDNFNAEPPRHLETFVDFVKEFVSWTCNRSSGAVGLPNLIPYMYYFWKKDCEENIYTDNYKAARQQIQRLIYALNQPFLRGGIQSAFTNTSVFDRPYLEALFGGAEFPDGTFMIDEIEGIMDFQKVYLETMSMIRSKNMMTFPVNTISLLKQNGKFVDEDFAKYAINHNMKWNDSNIFADSSVNSLSNCCRLKSNIEDLGYFNSIGGTALKVGSVKVGTINLARLALENKTEKEYLLALKDLVELNLKSLDRVRYIIKRNVEKGLLKNFSYGLVDFEHLYNTIGFIGIYETMKSFGYTRMDEFGNTYYTEEAEKFGKKIFDLIHNVKDTFVLDKDYTINCEQIPGETAAAKLMKKDKFFFGEKIIDDLPLYGNQFIPLGIKTTLKERIRIAALFDGFCNGGSILHVNIESPFKTFEQAWDMLNYITDQGVTYFAFNTKVQACKHNHAFFGTKCPECGEPVETEYTRIVGFYTPIKTYSKERKAEYEMREWENINGKSIN
jgi:ribonucleoside-triphosphate reductase